MEGAAPAASSRQPAALFAFLLALCCRLAAPAAELTITACDGVARPGIAVRFCIERSSAVETGRGPWLLQVSLEQDARIVANIDLPLERLAQARNGITATLPVPDGALERPLRLHAVLTSASRDLVEQTARLLPTPLSLARDARRAADRALAGAADPLPRLWTEQAAELALLPPSDFICERIAALTRRLDGWADGRRAPDADQGVRELACADAVDGSVQPCRLRLPTDPSQVIAVVLTDHPRPVIKSDWPTLPETWATAARANHVAVVEVYPAGDRTWSGVGPRRAALALAVCRRDSPSLARIPAVVVGAGWGANGALALTEADPLSWCGLALVAPRLVAVPAGDDPPALWLAQHRPGQRPGNTTGLPAFGAGPLPQGLAPWCMARERAGGQRVTDLPSPEDPGFWRTLSATALALHPAPPAAWTILAPGRFGDRTVPALAAWGVAEILHADETPRPVRGERKVLGRACGPLAAYADGPFVVVVGTGEHAAAVEDNRLLAECFVSAWRAHAHGDPPLVRDHAFRAGDFPHHHLVLIGNPRSNHVCADLVDAERLPVRWDGRAVHCGGLTRLRSAHTPLALCWPHPADDGRLLVILDGGPAWYGDGLPLDGLPDLVLGPPERPLFRRLFDNAWR